MQVLPSSGALVCLPLVSGLVGQAAAALSGRLAGSSFGRHVSTSGPGSQSQSKAAAAAPASEEQMHMTVNGRTVTLPKGSSIYDAVSKAGAFVPVLCKHPRLPNTPGSCRVCLVEVDKRLKPACCTPAHEGAVINTDTEDVVHTVTGTLALLRSNHPEDCMSCDVNGKCEFQDLINRYLVPKWPKLKDVSDDYIEHTATWSLYDQSSPAIKLDLEKCIKCSRCVTTCEEVQGMNVLGMFNRGRDRHIGFYHESDLELSKCIECGQCVSVCPVGALSEHTSWRQVLSLLQSKRKIMVAQTAPAVRVAIGEEAGLAPGSVTTGQMVAGLKRLGFDYVFDTDFAADLTIMEEGMELLQRLKLAWGLEKSAGTPPPLPMFTSCCPAWVTLVETEYPELIPNLSSCKSPQQMMGATVKAVWCKRNNLQPEDVCMVSIMPCTAKKHEAARPEMGRDGYKDIDHVLTTRELGRMFRFQHIDMASLPKDSYDDPMGTGSGAGVLFGNTGGVMEAAVRTVYEVVTGKELPHLSLEAVRGLKGTKEASLQLQLDGDTTKTVRVAVCSGVVNARKLVEDVRAGTANYDFVEVMSCPGGCIGGGGQPKTKGPDVLQRRMAAVYSIDSNMHLRKSHENPQIKKLYADELGKPNSEEAHHLLHTKYHDRSTERGSGAVFAKEDAPMPEEVAAALHESNMPGPAAGWKFQPLFKPQQQPEAPPRRQPATRGF
ncbi:hypothetical protein OEZ85_013628 [Tetradesmus obliquus]|uniref:Uncharacterized protein n=1 Tax=Tetradesmus obliquus TaxID=3088 RepID=A0ABY8UUI7_TETOB|nr:hypothetical protein OEZ85_013628 [Tetradesmus obliquus]